MSSPLRSVATLLLLALLASALCLTAEALSARSMHRSMTQNGATNMRPMADALGDNTTPSNGHARSENVGYLFLGAVLALFVGLALLFMLLHKPPVIIPTKQYPVKTVEMEEVHPEVPPETVAVPAAAPAPVAAVPAPQHQVAFHEQLGHQDVDALKHNVMDDQQPAALPAGHEARPAQIISPENEEEVHYVLHE